VRLRFHNRSFSTVSTGRWGMNLGPESCGRIAAYA
jgi:hypothetical protein